MPDHLHLLASFPATEVMASVVSDWKHYLARQAGIVWQRDFFDHRVRSNAGLDEKASYIRQNPVRAGLIGDPKDWPYVWQPDDLMATPAGRSVP